MKDKFEIVCFDADDTLWVNEPYYRSVENEFLKMMAGYVEKDLVRDDLHRTEIDNLDLYGYGAKGFMLSMIETALRLAGDRIKGGDIQIVLDLGRELIQKPVVLLDGVEETLKNLDESDMKLIVATKGDLLDQERKLENSGLVKYFDHIEIMSNKTPEQYEKLIGHLGIEPREFLMVGNSMKSDMLPVLAVGGRCAYIPFHMTWEHEIAQHCKGASGLWELESITQIREIPGVG
jgi:putative hydrolase of the HAD superfamily